MKKRIILLVILFLGIAGLIFSFPTLQTSAKLGDDFFEDFEDTIFPDWDAIGLWHREDNTSSNWPIWSWIPSGQHYMWYGQNTTGNYETGSINSGNLTSDKIDLTSLGGSIKLGFWSWSETENMPNVDKKWVEISLNNGLSWIFLGNVSDSSPWKYFSFDITDYGYSSEVLIRFCFDTVNNVANNYLGWMIDDIEIGSFELFIHQDRYAEVGETRGIDFEIRSYFSRQKGVVVTINLTHAHGWNTTLYPTQTEYIDGFRNWYHTEEYTFDYEGTYRVILIVDTNYGVYWTDCWWEIGDYFSLWIEQKNYALHYEGAQMWYYVESHYKDGIYVDISVNITQPSGSNKTIYAANNVYIAAHDTWQHLLSYPFTENGSYQVYLTVIDEYGKKWGTDCWWEIGPYFDIWVEQDQDALLREEKKMIFHVDSYFDTPMVVNISIIMELQSRKNDLITEKDFINIPARGSWQIKVLYEFMETGHHHAKLELVDTTGTEQWENQFCWNIFEGFKLEITQENYANVGEEYWMDFRITSHFPSLQLVQITINMQSPNGYDEILHSTTENIREFEFRFISKSYTFTEEGEYKVLLTVKNNGKEWIADCLWEVEGKSDSITSDSSEKESDSDERISPGFEGVFILGVLAISTILIRKSNRRLL